MTSVVTPLYWQDERDEPPPPLQSSVTDLAFAVTGVTLPVDHGLALARALARALPWLHDSPDVGAHLLYGAASGNGWARPSAPEATLYLAKRTRLTLRLPTSRVDAARALSGVALDLDGHRLLIGTATCRPLTTARTLYARHVADLAGDETAFLNEVARQLTVWGLPCTRLLPGQCATVRGPRGLVLTRSLLVGNLAPAQSLKLQEHGLGSGRLQGCGLFGPYREAVGPDPLATRS